MRTLQLKTFNKNFNYKGHFFFILNKGMNSGKPMKTPCPNCFVCMAASEEEKEHLFWICYILWQSKSFHYYLKGSVIQFISIKELNSILSKNYAKFTQNKPQWKEAISLFQNLDAMENQYQKNIKLIHQYRKAYIQKI